MVKHCECLDCQKARAYKQYFQDNPYRVGECPASNGDNLEGKPEDFIGGELIALKDVNILTSPNGSVVRIVKAGDKVGNIYSFVVRDGIVYWQLDDMNFVKHEPETFDDLALSYSLRKLADEKKEAVMAAAKERMDANDNPLYNLLPDLEDWVKWIVFTIVGLLVTAIVLKLAK